MKQMKRLVILVGACLAIALVYISVTYVHLGYVGVIDTGDGPKLLDRGLHLRPPLARVTFYPVECRQIHLTTIDDGVHGRIEFDVVLLLSVSREKVIHLHETYGGAFVERLISPLVLEHFRSQGNGSGDWGDGVGSDKAAEGIVKRIFSEATPHGVNIVQARIRSFDVRLTD
jgi:hypothetical protein